MKLCSQCGYGNGDYMEICARCSAPLTPPAQSLPVNNTDAYSAPAETPNASAMNTYGAYPANMPQVTRPQAYPTVQNGFERQGVMPNEQGGGMMPPGMPSSYPPAQPYNMPSLSPGSQSQMPYQGMPGQMQPPGMPGQGIPPMPPDYPVQSVQPPYPYPAPPPPLAPPQYQNSPYPYGSQQTRPPEPPRQLPPLDRDLSDLLVEKNADKPLPVKAKRSPVWGVLLVLLVLLILVGGFTYWFHVNGMFPAEVSQKIDGVISSVTGFFGGSTEDREKQEAYDTMVSRVCNTTGADEDQAKALVDILLYQCGASDIFGIGGYHEANTYKVNTPEGVCLIRLDPTSKTLLEVLTVETNPRYIYQNGNVLNSIKNLCVSEEEMRMLKEHAQERVQSYLPKEKASEYAFAGEEEWEFHKEQNWVAVYSYVAPPADGGYLERIPFYFEYEYSIKDNQPSYTLKYAMIQEQSTGNRHFNDLINPFGDTSVSSDTSNSSSSASSSDTPPSSEDPAASSAN